MTLFFIEKVKIPSSVAPVSPGGLHHLGTKERSSMQLDAIPGDMTANKMGSSEWENCIDLSLFLQREEKDLYRTSDCTEKGVRTKEI